MRHTIETAPRDGQAIILDDEASGTYDVAHWSPETGKWVGENGEPSKITPSHWYPLQGDNYLQQGHDISSSPPGPGRWRRQRAPPPARRSKRSARRTRGGDLQLP
jgi:hypothetical protein